LNYTELQQLVKHGVEYLFCLDDNEYWISQNADGYYLTRQDGYSQDFVTSEELFRDGRIEGKTILELWDKIKDQF